MISFIIPTYNKSQSIIRSIKSVQEQTDSLWELLIIDDGSSDNTREVVEPFLSDVRINYFFQKNGGVSAARNSGAYLAKGEYLIFLDSDDIFNPQLLEQLNAKSYKNFDFICWEVKKITEKKTEIIKPKFLGPLFNNTTAIFLAGSFCLKRDLFWKVGGYDTEITFGENYELGIRISQLNNLKIRLIQETFIQYNLDSFERTSNSIQNRLFSLFRQYKKHKEIYISYTKLNAKAFYFFGYLLEKSFKYNYAEKLYMASWRLTPWNMKYLLKYFLLKLKKR